MTRGWIRRLAAECARHRALLTITLAVTAVGVAIDLSVPLVTKAAIDTATGAASHGFSIATLGGALVALGVVRFVAQFFRRLTAGRLSLTVQNVLRTSILSTLLRLDGPSVDRIVTGQVVSRSISDLQLVQGLLAMVPLSLGAVVQVVLAFAVMAYLSPLLTLVALLVIPLVAVVAFRTRRSLFAATWSAQQTAADVAQHVEETVTGVRVVKGFGQEERSVDELAGHGRRLFSQRMRAARINARFSPTMNAIPQLALVAIVALGGILTARGDITVGTFLAFATYVTTMTGLARLLTNLVVSAQLARAAVERVYDVIDHPTDPRYLSEPAPGGAPPGSVGVRVSDVDVDLPDGTALFRGLDLSVAPGEAVAVVGPPGSGKSTLAAVLAGLAPARRGSVELVDGATGVGLDVADADLEAIRSRIGIVFDDPFLYSDSIAANIALGPAADGLDAGYLRERVERAARRAAAHDFIAALPDGYDTVVGERGLTLSGGQRQRIALARAFFVDPPVLVLDDATSAVDATTEAAILAELRETPGRTLVLIAHRRSTLAPADRVVVLDRGRVVESGPPADVAARSTLFRSLMADPGTATTPAADDVVVAPVPNRAALWPEDTEVRDPGTGDRVRPAAPPRAGRRGGGGVSSALGSMPATPALLEAVAELPPATEDPRVDEAEARAPDPAFSLRGLLRPVRGLLLLAVVAVAVDTATGLAFPTLARLGVNAATQDRLSTLWLTTAAGLVAVAVGWIALSVTTITSTRAGERVLFRLRVRSYAHLQRLGLDYYERELSGRIMTRMTTDIDALSSFLQTGLSTTVIALLTIVGVAAALIVTDPSLGAIVVVALVPLGIATVVFQRVASRAYTRSRELVSAVNADFQENIAGLRTTTSYRNDSRARARFGDLAGQYVEARMVSQRAISLYFPFITLVSDLATAAAVGIGASQVASGQTQPGTIVAFVLYLGMLFSPVQQLSQVFDGYQQAVVGLRRIGDLLRTPSSLESDPATGPTATTTPSTSGPSAHAELDSVRFRYSGAADDALRGVDLDIPAGTSLALVGQTGAGKSTIVKLLARFYDPTDGSVRLDGRDIREVPLRAHRKRLGVVPQEAHLFTGTIASNIAYGDPTASRERIEAAAAAVGALDVIAGMRGGMTHRVGERGQGLSAGQRQLIALARAELVDPDLLLLDEATATLDQATERRVLDAGRRLARSRTAVIVAHRLATAARADRIAVVADGRIVELGTHADLLALNGRYRVLWDTGSATGRTTTETADAG
ncbi:ABC transporter ATP-binding protein [Williamsia serinedens]|uniref:ATP-binding cassette, subfamily B n=1 Tax=Williamsia serinedens TaxID=391736 RepID=A0ABT1H6R0_9NOCA|nr:ABC transporter ATP-binding protein [Williamsia serinedens]MCP2162915.1 ATP-binding cassette, subfamily B [Williamsia serinedens]